LSEEFESSHHQLKQLTVHLTPMLGFNVKHNLIKYSKMVLNACPSMKCCQGYNFDLESSLKAIQNFLENLNSPCDDSVTQSNTPDHYDETSNQFFEDNFFNSSEQTYQKNVDEFKQDDDYSGRLLCSIESDAPDQIPLSLESDNSAMMSVSCGSSRSSTFSFSSDDYDISNTNSCDSSDFNYSLLTEKMETSRLIEFSCSVPQNRSSIIPSDFLNIGTHLKRKNDEANLDNNLGQSLYTINHSLAKSQSFPSSKKPRVENS